MMRDAQRIDHMLGFVRRCRQILEGVDSSAYLASLGLQEQVELNMLHLGEVAARISDDVKDAHPENLRNSARGILRLLSALDATGYGKAST